MTTRRELEKLAKSKGFYPTDKGKGSHVLWEHEDGRAILISNPKQKRLQAQDPEECSQSPKRRVGAEAPPFWVVIG